ncbi:MAG: hypothetical protein ACREQ5_04745 [Candidatus Dormibacteria bacterium]
MAISIAASPANFLTSSLSPQSFGTDKVFLASISCDASYPTGGYSVNPYLFGLNLIKFIIVPAALVPGGVVAYLIWNETTNLLQAFNQTGAEIANTTDLHTVIVSVIIFGH